MSKRKFKYEKYKYDFEEKEPLFYWTVSNCQLDEAKYELLFNQYDFYKKSSIAADNFRTNMTTIRFTDFIDNTNE